MAYFAKMDGNKVLTVVAVHNNEILDENGNESEAKGIEFLKKTLGKDTEWLRTSFGSKNGKHYHVDPITGEVKSEKQIAEQYGLNIEDFTSQSELISGSAVDQTRVGETFGTGEVHGGENI